MTRRAGGELGAAPLFYENNNTVRPTFEGRDLVTRFPGIEHADLTRDGATTGSTLELQLPRIPDDRPEPALVTLTAGGNDLMGIVHGGRGGGPSEDARRARRVVEEAVTNLRAIVTELADRFEEPTLLVGDVYDPSEGTGDLGDGLTEPDPDARWYWRHNPIELSARGASEVRRLWLKALDPSGTETTSEGGVT